VSFVDARCCWHYCFENGISKPFAILRGVVQAGERLAVIEAMKMENILTAAQDGTVSELMAAQGESLAVDQPILKFV
jgi:biotin carboxyl carrier protein